MRTQAPARASAASTTIAVDLGATSVRVVEIEFTGGNGGLRVARRGVAPLPPGLWNDLAANRDGLSAAITQALASASIAGKTVVACMPRRMVTLRFVRLPPAPPELLRGMVEIEAQQYVLFPLDDVILDYHVVSDALDLANADDMHTVLLAAARRSLITEIMAAFDKAGLDLQQLSASALALAENGRDSLEPTALIDVEPGELDVAVVAAGQLLFTRAGALDLQGVRSEVAERREVEEVVRSFTAYQNEFRNRPIAHVFVGGESGSGAGGESLNSALSEMLEMAVTPLTPRGLPPGDAEGRAWATAVGMALQSRVGSIAPINLVPNERAERRAHQARNRRQQLMALAGAGAAAVAIYFGNIAYANAKKTAAETLAENSSLQENQDKLGKLTKEHDKVKTLAEDVIKGLDRNHPSVDVVYALNRALPTSADIWLTQLQFERGGLLTLHGETKNAVAATQLVLALQKSGSFTDVRLSYVGDAQENTPSSAPVQPAPVPAPTETTAANNTNNTNSVTNNSVTVNVPQLPGPGSPGAGGGSGFGGRFRGNGGPVTFTPGAFPNGFQGGSANPSAYPPATDASGGNPGFAPNGGQGGNFPQGGQPNFPQGGQPNAPQQATPQGGQTAPQAAPPIIIVPGQTPLPNTRATRPDNGKRLGANTVPNGRLILAGWQDTSGQSGQGGFGGGGRQGGGGFGGGRRGRRNGNNGGGNYDPNAYNNYNNQGGGQNFQNGNNGGNGNNGNANSSTAPANPTTYSNGSVFGGSPQSTGGTQPNNGGQGQFPNGQGGFGGGFGGRGFGRFRGGNGPDGGGAVPPMTTPPGGIQRVARPPVIKPKPVKTNPSKQTLTSFVITCRVNVLRKDLVPANAAVPKTAAEDNGSVKKQAVTGRKSAASGESADNGGDDADTQ